jgi:lysozyme
MMAGQQDPYYNDFGQDDSMYEPVVITATGSSTPEPYPTSSQNTEIYIVQKGDILSQLAVDFDTTTATLVELNNLSNPDVLYVGQELRVPAGSRKKSGSASKPQGSIKKGGSYTIQKGDTLSEIALAAGVSIDDLRELNGIKGDMIMAGETIDIPSYGKVPAAKKKTASAPKTTEPAPVEPAPAPEAAAPAPAPLASVESAPEATDSSTSVGMVVDHVVYPGETLDDISRQYGVTKAEIMRLNNISDETMVKEQMRLRIPIAE